MAIAAKQEAITRERIQEMLAWTPRRYRLKCEEHEIEGVRQWLQSVGAYVAIRDCMAVSFALDYERQDGNPENPQTVVGQLRARAKPYGRAPTEDGYAAAAQLVASASNS